MSVFIPPRFALAVARAAELSGLDSELARQAAALLDNAGISVRKAAVIVRYVIAPLFGGPDAVAQAVEQLQENRRRYREVHPTLCKDGRRRWRQGKGIHAYSPYR